jgi:ASC-1-like (ASCH) protein
VPLLKVKKEVFDWIERGIKTIDVRRGKAQKGNVALFQSGPRSLRVNITKKEQGRIDALVRQQNYRHIVPVARSLEDAIEYLRQLYETTDGIFSAYYFDIHEGGEKMVASCIVDPLKKKHKSLSVS